jgi:hypothetical protein
VGQDVILGVTLPDDRSTGLTWMRQFRGVYSRSYVECRDDPAAVPNGLMASLITDATAAEGDDRAGYVARGACFEGLAGVPNIEAVP